MTQPGVDVNAEPLPKLEEAAQGFARDLLAFFSKVGWAARAPFSQMQLKFSLPFQTQQVELLEAIQVDGQAQIVS